MRVLLVVALFLLSMNLQADVRFTHLFTSYNTSIETNIGVVGVISEDKQGFIWFGGKNGLARFDGHSFKVYRKTLDEISSLPSNFIRDIAFDQDGVMWVATSEGLAEYEPELDHFKRLDINLKSNPQPVSQDINSIDVDRFNNLIIGTHIGVVVINSKRMVTHHFLHNPNSNNSLSDNDVRVIAVDSKNQVWIGTNSAGVSVLNIETLEFKHFKHEPSNPKSLAGNSIRSIFEDQQGRIWIGTYGAGVSRLNKSDNSFTHYLSSKIEHGSSGGYAIHSILQDRQQNLWLATDHGGLARYNTISDHFEYYTHDLFDSYSINSNQVRYIYEDKVGDLWVSTFPGGIDFVDRSSTSFRNYRHNPNDPTTLSDSAVLCFFKDSTGDFWVGTENGLNLFDVENNKFTRILPDTKNKNGLLYGTVLAMEEDIDGNLWVGTWSGGLHRYNKKTGQFKHYTVEADDPFSISSKYIWSIHLDSSGTVWIGTESGLNRYDRKSDHFVTFKENAQKIDSISDNDVRDIIETPNGDLWIATFGGLDRFNPKNEVFTHFRPDKNDVNSIRGIRITDLLEAKDGRIWVATQDEGLNIYSPAENKFQHIGILEGLPTNELAGLLEDDQGDIWVNSSSGLLKVDKTSFQVKHYTKEHGLVGDNFNRSASYKDQFGNLYFGGTDGISIFHPSQLLTSSIISPIYIVGVSTLSMASSASMHSQRLQNSQYQSLLHTDELIFDYRVFGFTFDFSLLSYRSSNQNSYAYMLEGFDSDWRFAGAKHEATYTNIAPGHYTFKVKAANRDGFWMPEGDSLNIYIKPAPWFTWWAYCIYSFFILLIMLFLFRLQLKRTELQREKQLNAKLISVDRIKDAILANTSHELRSPLNSIVGISESLVDGIAGELNRAVKDYLKIISNNGKKLTNLVDNILDYASLIDNEEKVISRPVDVFSLVQSVLSSYPSILNVTLINNVSRAAPMILADEERLLQVFKSLVDNALSFTKNGSITVDCEERLHSLKITITDTGDGMSSSQLQQLFSPFVCTEGVDSSPLSGIGLGLAISKHLVELHGGKIDVKSQQGIGTCFSITFPIDKNYSVSSLVQPSIEKIKNSTLPKEEAKHQELSIHAINLDQEFKLILGQVKTCTVLIVDDDAINRMVLMSMLSQYQFNTLEAESGQKAIDTVNTHGDTIDIIIMDVMMPGMSGYEACRHIRKLYSQHSLPIIFLTAKRVPYSAADGFLVGGNDFMSKPVSKYELLPRMLNLLKTIKIVKNQG